MQFHLLQTIHLVVRLRFFTHARDMVTYANALIVVQLSLLRRDLIFFACEKSFCTNLKAYLGDATCNRMISS